jgi:hypothetical protein
MSDAKNPFYALVPIDGDLCEVTLHHDPEKCGCPQESPWHCKCPACYAEFLCQLIVDHVVVLVTEIEETPIEANNAHHPCDI